MHFVCAGFFDFTETAISEKWERIRKRHMPPDVKIRSCSQSNQNCFAAASLFHIVSRNYFKLFLYSLGVEPTMDLNVRINVVLLLNPTAS